MIAENEQRLIEALLLLSFSPEELAPLSREEIRILAAAPYAPLPTAAAELGGEPLGAQYRRMRELMLAAHRRSRPITPAQQKRRRRSARRCAAPAPPPSDPEPT